MKAFIITEPGETRIGEIPVPTAGPGEVLLQTRLIGMCGTDLNTFRGKNPLVTYPRVPGHEIAATIVEVGPGCSGRIPAGPQRNLLALHRLRPVRFMQAQSTQCLRFEPNARRAARRCHGGIFCNSLAQALRGRRIIAS